MQKYYEEKQRSNEELTRRESADGVARHACERASTQNSIDRLQNSGALVILESSK